MPSLPANSTDRYYLDYTCGGIDHTMVVRAQSGVLPSGAAADIATFLGILSPALFLVTIRGLRYSAAGSNVSNPVPWTGAASYGADAAEGLNRAKFIGFVARDAAGHKTRVDMFCPKTGSDPNFRTTRAESALIGDVIDFLDGTTGTFRSINNLHPTWKEYANFAFNAYWQRQLRRLG